MPCNSRKKTRADSHHQRSTIKNRIKSRMGCSKIVLMGKAWRQVKAMVSATGTNFQQRGDYRAHRNGKADIQRIWRYISELFGVKLGSHDLVKRRVPAWCCRCCGCEAGLMLSQRLSWTRLPNSPCSLQYWLAREQLIIQPQLDSAQFWCWTQVLTTVPAEVLLLYTAIQRRIKKGVPYQQRLLRVITKAATWPRCSFTTSAKLSSSSLQSCFLGYWLIDLTLLALFAQKNSGKTFSYWGTWFSISV